MYTEQGISNVLTGDMFPVKMRGFSPETVKDDAIRYYMNSLRYELMMAYFNSANIKTVELFMAKKHKEFDNNTSDSRLDKVMRDCYMTAHQRINQLLMGA